MLSGDLPPADASQGALTQFGQVTASLASVAAPQKLSFEVDLRDTAVANDWPLWVFPETLEMPQPERLVVAREWTESLRRELVDGATVVLFARRLLNAEPIRFANVFWSPFWVSNQPMSSGLVIDTGHPSLAHFPTDTHSNWHWWELLSIVEEVEYTEQELFRGNGVLSPARAVVLNDLPAELVPIIQVIDQPLRNNREAVLFEAAVGRGRLLVCTLDVDSHLERRIVARQLRYSLLSYAASEPGAPHRGPSTYPGDLRITGNQGGSPELRAQPHATLAEVTAEFMRRTELTVNAATVLKALRQAGVKRKRGAVVVKRRAEEEAKRYGYRDEHRRQEPEQAIRRSGSVRARRGGAAGSAGVHPFVAVRVLWTGTRRETARAVIPARRSGDLQGAANTKCRAAIPTAPAPVKQEHQIAGIVGKSRGVAADSKGSGASSQPAAIRATA